MTPILMAPGRHNPRWGKQKLFSIDRDELWCFTQKSCTFPWQLSWFVACQLVCTQYASHSVVVCHILYSLGFLVAPEVKNDKRSRKGYPVSIWRVVFCPLRIRCTFLLPLLHRCPRGHPNLQRMSLSGQHRVSFSFERSLEAHSSQSTFRLFPDFCVPC